MRIALQVSYDGTNYYGWQAQDGLATIAGNLEEALSFIANEKITCVCAGRTDAGVHALRQIIHFDTSARRSDYAWVAGVNSRLPPEIRVIWAKEVDEKFHARFSAVARTYNYTIYNAAVASARLGRFTTLERIPLNISKMQQASEYLLGEHDFSSFRGSGCESRTPMRNLLRLNIVNTRPLVEITITANAFLLHMVRNIVGTLLKIGRGEHPPEWIKEVLAAKNRIVAGPTAPAAGLCLIDVSYPDFALPCPIIM